MQEQQKDKPTLAGEGVAFQSKGKEHLDFVTSIVLAIVCIAAIIASYGYYKASGSIFYESPGFMPIIIAVGILFCAIILFLGSIKGSSPKERMSQVMDAIHPTLKSNKFINSMAGLIIFGIYIFILLKLLPFWLASLLLLLFCYFFSNATTPIKILIIAVLSVAGIVLLFQVAFRVPLP